MNAVKLCQATIRIRWLKDANVSRNISVQFYLDEDRHVYEHDCLFILQPPEQDW
jgi:hypothetical protein